LFKYLIGKFKLTGSEVFVTARQKDITVDLLKEEAIDFTLLGNNHPGFFGKIRNLFEYDYLLYQYCRKIKPDVLISHSSIYAAHAAFLLGKKSITLEDTGNPEQSFLYRPFTDYIVTPECLNKNYGRKQVKYKGFHELAYLHPNYFTPDSSIFNLLGINQDDKFSLIRFVSRNSSHDIGVTGLSLSDKVRIVNNLSEFSRVFITSEEQLPAELSAYQLNLPVSKIHHAIYFANLVIGESATMCSEAAILGTPSIYFDYFGRHYTDFQEKEYGLVMNFVRKNLNVDKAIDNAVSILSDKNSKEVFKEKSKQLISDHIDVTQFLYNFINTNIFKE